MIRMIITNNNDYIADDNTGVDKVINCMDGLILTPDIRYYVHWGQIVKYWYQQETSKPFQSVINLYLLAAGSGYHIWLMDTTIYLSQCFFTYRYWITIMNK